MGLTDFQIGMISTLSLYWVATQTLFGKVLLTLFRGLGGFIDWVGLHEQSGGKSASGSMSGNVGWHWQFACGAVITWQK